MGSGSSPIEFPTLGAHSEDMEITGFVENVTSILFDPHVLASALALTVGLLSGAVARIVEWLEVRPGRVPARDW